MDILNGAEWVDGVCVFLETPSSLKLWVFDDYRKVHAMPENLGKKLFGVERFSEQACVVCVDTRVHEAFDFLGNPHDRSSETGPFLCLLIEKFPRTLVPERFGGPVTHFVQEIKNCECLFDLCGTKLPWKKETIRGKFVNRRTCAVAKFPGTVYRYAGTTKIASQWPRFIQKLVDTVPKLRFANFVLGQFYQDGKSVIGWHSDSTRDLVPGYPVVSLSLGASRKFCLRPKNDGLSTSAILGNGDILVMDGDTQKNWMHCIASDSNVKNARICLTFRNMK